MGASASLSTVYAEAHKWFQIYIDKETYVSDFQELDPHGSGGVTVGAVQKWITDKAVSYPDSCWSIFLASGNAIMMSHKAAAMHMDSTSSVSSRKVVDITEFKAFLIHLFATSILWRHFSASDQFTAEHHSGEMFRKKLNLQEFCTACRSLCDAHAKEKLSKEQLRTDFKMLDDNCDGLVGFVQICSHCCKFINGCGEDSENMPLNSKRVMQDVNGKASKILGLNAPTGSMKADMADSGGYVRNIMGEFGSGNKAVFAHLSTEEKTAIAMEQVKRKIDKEDDLVHNYHVKRRNRGDADLQSLSGYSGYSAYSGYSGYSNHNSAEPLTQSLHDSSVSEKESSNIHMMSRVDDKLCTGVAGIDIDDPGYEQADAKRGGVYSRGSEVKERSECKDYK